MAAGTTIKHKRKAGAFVNGELQAGEQGLDVTSGDWWFSRNGTTVEKKEAAGGAGGDADTLGGQLPSYYLDAANLTGTLPTGVIPVRAITDVSVIASEAAQLALTAEEGDVAVRTDEGKSYIHLGTATGTMADWQALPAIGLVTSVNGQQGVIVLGPADVGAAPASHTHNASDINAGDLAAARLTANLLAALNALGVGSVQNANLTIDGGTL
jgi:hypothetical protein